MIVPGSGLYKCALTIGMCFSIHCPHAASNCVSQSLFVKARAGEINWVVRLLSAKTGASALAASWGEVRGVKPM